MTDSDGLTCERNSELTFEEHPGERAQEEEVQQTGHDTADDPLIRLADPTNEQHLGYQQAHAEILVDRRPVRLQTGSSESREKIPSRRDCTLNRSARGYIRYL